MYTTLNEIRTHCPCSEGIETLMSNLGKIDQDEHISFETILKSNGVYELPAQVSSIGRRGGEMSIAIGLFLFVALPIVVGKAISFGMTGRI